MMLFRYDVAFDANVLGAKHVCAFSKKCTKLKMLLHVSTGAEQYIAPSIHDLCILDVEPCMSF